MASRQCVPICKTAYDYCDFMEKIIFQLRQFYANEMKCFVSDEQSIDENMHI